MSKRTARKFAQQREEHYELKREKREMLIAKPGDLARALSGQPGTHAAAAREGQPPMNRRARRSQRHQPTRRTAVSA